MFYNNVCYFIFNLAIFSYEAYFCNDDSVNKILNNRTLLYEILIIGFAGAFG